MENNNNKYLVKYMIGEEEINLTPERVKLYLTNGQDISISDFKMFSELCKRRKLNPFLKECYIIKYSDKLPAQIVVGKDAILKRAILNSDFDGREQGIIVVNGDKKIIEKNGTFISTDEKLIGGWAKVYRKNWKYPVYITVSFDEVSQKTKEYQDFKTGEVKPAALNSNWATKGATMVEKVALVRALREAFAEDIGGMVDEGEVWNEENIINQPRATTQEIEQQVEPEIIEEAEIVDIENL